MEVHPTAMTVRACVTVLTDGWEGTVNIKHLITHVTASPASTRAYVRWTSYQREVYAYLSTSYSYEMLENINLSSSLFM